MSDVKISKIIRSYEQGNISSKIMTEDIKAIINPKMTPEEFIQYMADMFAENRTDVEEMCVDFLAGNFDKNLYFKSESRFISASIPETNIDVEYDTLTTEISFSHNGTNWKQCINHEYRDN